MVAIIKNVKEEGPGSIEDFLKEKSIPFKIFEAESGEFPASLKEYKKNISKVFHWHGDTFDLPSGAIHLASSGLYQNQAFKYEDRFYALQFHVEVTEDLLSTWFENSPLKERVLSEFQTLKSEYSERAKNFYQAFFY
jgi:GMP synthase-like glutamine amidotransferase